MSEKSKCQNCTECPGCGNETRLSFKRARREGWRRWQDRQLYCRTCYRVKVIEHKSTTNE